MEASYIQRNEFIEKYAYLVHKIATPYCARNIPYIEPDDLIGFGFQALWKVADGVINQTINLPKTVRIEARIGSDIKYAILTGIQKEGSTPERARRAIYFLKRARSKIEEGTKGRPATESEMRSHLGDAKFFSLMESSQMTRTSLDVPVCENSSYSFADYIPSNDANPHSVLVEQEEAQSLEKMVETLPEKLKAIVHAHYLDGTPFGEIAQSMGEKECMIRRENRRALGLLREQLSRHAEDVGLGRRRINGRVCRRCGESQPENDRSTCSKCLKEEREARRTKPIGPVLVRPKSLKQTVYDSLGAAPLHVSEIAATTGLSIRQAATVANQLVLPFDSPVIRVGKGLYMRPEGAPVFVGKKQGTPRVYKGGEPRNPPRPRRPEGSGPPCNRCRYNDRSPGMKSCQSCRDRELELKTGKGLKPMPRNYKPVSCAKHEAVCAAIKGGPLHIKEVAAITGMPQKKVAAMLLHLATRKKEKSPLVRVGFGIYTLRENAANFTGPAPTACQKIINCLHGGPRRIAEVASMTGLSMKIAASLLASLTRSLKVFRLDRGVYGLPDAVMGPHRINREQSRPQVEQRAGGAESPRLFDMNP